MAARLKGNLGLKSSPLAPTACKLSTQYLVLDHMTNHYNKIAKAKSAIDSKPPKSLSTSQKMRDRRNRDKIAHSPRTRPTSAMSQSGHQMYQDYLDIQDEPEDEEDELVHSIMKSTLLDKGYSSTSLQENGHATASRSFHLHPGEYDYGEHGRESRMTQPRPGSARSIQSGHSLGPGRLGTAASAGHDPTKITYQGDVLDKRAHLFTEPERPFTPRTLRNNHQSRLKNSKCYNPPPNKPGSRTSTMRPGPRPQPRSRGRQYNQKTPGQEDYIEHGDNDMRHRRRDSFHGLGDTMGETMETTGQMSESALMDITLQSRDGRHFRGHRGNMLRGGVEGEEGEEREEGMVPPLAISMDQDHMNWLQEQASKAQVRARGLGPSVSEADTRTTEHSRYHQNSHPQAKQRAAYKVPEVIQREAVQKDEDQKYLAFAKEVTDDVLSRGICSDSVLHRVFENHIERKKGHLDVDRMREVIRDLRRDLGLRDSSAERTPLASLCASRPGNAYNNNDNNSRGVLGPVTVITSSNGDDSTSNNQQPSSSSKGTTGSTSAKDESSSATFSPGHHYQGVLKGKYGGTTLEPLQVMSSPSENGGLSTSATLESVSSFRFGQTGDMVDTIASEAIQEDTAREREEAEEEEEERRRIDEAQSGEDELTATQALKQYEFDLTVKEGTAEHATNGTTNGTNGTSASAVGDSEVGESRSSHSESGGAGRRVARDRRAKARLERPATGERRSEGDGEDERGQSEDSSSHVGAASKNRAALSSGGSSSSSKRQRRRDSQKVQGSDDNQSSKSRTNDSLNNTEGSSRAEFESNRSGGETSAEHLSSTTTPSQGRSGGRVQDQDNRSVDEDAASMKSVASSLSQQQRPAVRPRTKRGDYEVKGQREEEKVSTTPTNVEEKEEKQEDDYEDDYEEEIEEDVDESTHRTSDDDF